MYTFKIVCNCGKELNCQINIEGLANSCITQIGCSNCEFINSISIEKIKEIGKVLE